MECRRKSLEQNVLRALAVEVTITELIARLLEWLAWMDREIDNIRSVLQRCLIGPVSAQAIPLASSVSWYWSTRATTDGVRWLDQPLASGDGALVPARSTSSTVRTFAGLPSLFAVEQVLESESALGGLLQARARGAMEVTSIVRVA